MSLLGNKGKKMSFDQYHTKLNQKKPIIKQNTLKQNPKKPHSNKNINHESFKNKEIHFHQVPSEPYNNNIASHALPVQNKKSKGEIEKSYKQFKQYDLSSESNYVSQERNDKQQKKQKNQSISLPVSHDENILYEEQSSIKKIDLIFEKEPQQVQNKLRMLLLNYNAVMQYNQDDDKFQVDLLLPFQSTEQQQAFVQKFHRTRRNIKDKILIQKQLQQQINKNPQHQQNEQINKQNEFQDRQYVDERNLQNIHQLKQLNKNQIDSNSKNSKINSQQTLLNVIDNEEELQIENEKYSQDYKNQCRQKNELLDSPIDFYQLSFSLERSIKKAMNLIKPQSEFYLNSHQNQSQFKQNQHQSITNQNYSSLRDQNLQNGFGSQKLNKKSQLLVDIDQKKQVQLSEKQINKVQSQLSIKSKEIHPLSSNYNSQSQQKLNQKNKGQNQSLSQKNIKQYQKINQQNTNQQYGETQMYSQAEESITSCDHPSQPHSINYNTNHAYLSNHSVKQQNSHINPQFPHSITGSYQMSNISNNQILIQDQFLQNYPINSYQKSYPSQNPTQFQNSYDSIDSNQEFTMIEQTQEQHQQEIFISPREYQNFLKSQLISVHSNPANKDIFNFPNQTKYVSSFKKDYDQFLKRNRNKIEKLYLRIGNHMSKRDKKGVSQSSINKKSGNEVFISQDQNQENKHRLSYESELQGGMLEDFRRRIVLENESMSSQDKVRYFRYLARNAKKLYIDYIKSQVPKNKT